MEGLTSSSHLRVTRSVDEIRDDLFPQRSPTDRRDLIARVFRQKVSVIRLQ